MRLLITGGAGFIGTSLIGHLLAATRHHILNLDRLAYPANHDALAAFAGQARYRFEQGDINDGERLATLFAEHQPTAVIHLAAQTHVDRSIAAPAAFLRDNVDGTFVLLEAARGFWSELPRGRRDTFRFLHISTDEVFGGLATSQPIDEDTPYQPHSPYAASKAAADSFVKAYRHTYGFPAVIVHPSNNYGPRQFVEKLIPHSIDCALRGDAIPVYGDGLNVRDWVHVDDHVRALTLLLEQPLAARSYCVGGGNPLTTLALVQRICALLDDRRRREAGHHARLIAHVADRPGHDRHYHVDSTRLRTELGWRPTVDFEHGLATTVDWYIERHASGVGLTK